MGKKKQGNKFDGLRVYWTQGYQCESFLSYPDETSDPEDFSTCSAPAEVKLAFKDGQIKHECYHHYIMWTATPDRLIEA